MWVALGAAVGTGALVVDGLYPRFDEGKLRVVIALTSAVFAAAVAAFAVRAPSSGGAAGRAIGMSALLGVANTILPAAILGGDRFGEFAGMCVVGVFFGAPTGALYGVPLAVLVGFGHRHVRAGSANGTDQAARIAGLWSAAMGAGALAGSILLDDSSPPRLLAALVAAVGLAVWLRASRALRQRNAWIARVREGAEPRYRIRSPDLRDDLRAVPRLAEGDAVVELVPEAEETVSVYRFPAVGTPVAIVD
jgi:hypothetical protein